MNIVQMAVTAMERGWVPDALTRRAIRRMCSTRLRGVGVEAKQPPDSNRKQFLESLRQGPIALASRESNEQHYELPPEFFALLLGARRKYSCCYWPAGTTTLDAAEEAALTITCERAGIQNGQDILELGCGWGSLSLWMAQQYPDSRILVMSHSVAQRRYIETIAREHRLTNLRVVTSDINEFQLPPETTLDGRFDRIVSIEMFEHLRNYELLLARIASWLRPQGQLFVHIFCHRKWTYPFEVRGPADWMAQHFFTGGMMPGAGLLGSFSGDLQVVRQWHWSGMHYQRTAQAWLNNLDARRSEVLDVLRSVYGPESAAIWLRRWRIFLLAVAELFSFNGGREWMVSHSLMQHASASPRN